MIRSITSRDNSLLMLARAVRDGRNTEYIFIEGLRLCEEALRSSLQIEALIVSEELLRKERVAAAIAELEQAADRSASVSEKLLESISYTKTPQGIVVLAEFCEQGFTIFHESQRASSLVQRDDLMTRSLT